MGVIPLPAASKDDLAVGRGVETELAEGAGGFDG
jgi:hypothetical protein